MNTSTLKIGTYKMPTIEACIAEPYEFKIEFDYLLGYSLSFIKDDYLSVMLTDKQARWLLSRKPVNTNYPVTM